jgi:chitinase
MKDKTNNELRDSITSLVKGYPRDDRGAIQINDLTVILSIEQLIEQREQALKAELLEKIEEMKYTEDQGIDAEMESANIAIEDIKTIINSIFKD